MNIVSNQLNILKIVIGLIVLIKGGFLNAQQMTAVAEVTNVAKAFDKICKYPSMTPNKWNIDLPKRVDGPSEQSDGFNPFDIKLLPSLEDATASTFADITHRDAFGNPEAASQMPALLYKEASENPNKPIQKAIKNHVIFNEIIKSGKGRFNDSRPFTALALLRYSSYQQIQRSSSLRQKLSTAVIDALKKGEEKEQRKTVQAAIKEAQSNTATEDMINNLKQSAATKNLTNKGEGRFIIAETDEAYQEAQKALFADISKVNLVNRTIYNELNSKNPSVRHSAFATTLAHHTILQEFIFPRESASDANLFFWFQSTSRSFKKSPVANYWYPFIHRFAGGPSYNNAEQAFKELQAPIADLTLFIWTGLADKYLHTNDDNIKKIIQYTAQGIKQKHYWLTEVAVDPANSILKQLIKELQQLIQKCHKA